MKELIIKRDAFVKYFYGERLNPQSKRGKGEADEEG